jgi:beta-xylosidase
MNSQPVVQFTGYDGHPYAIQVSSDLVNWTSISTNFPVGGVITFTSPGMSNANQQFYRSVLLQ